MASKIINIDRSEAYKILDALRENELFHQRRDEMNSQIHLAKEVRYSPITTITMAAVERFFSLVNDIDFEEK